MIGTAATVTGTVPSYAGGSIVARFISQGVFPDNPDLRRLEVVGSLDASGFFSIDAWNNGYTYLAPSLTQVTIALGGSSFTVLVFDNLVQPRHIKRT